MHRRPEGIAGDGHTSMKVDRMKSTEDDRFQFRFSFMHAGHEKAFVTHYRPKHLPFSSEVRGVFDYLGLREFNHCPEFGRLAVERSLVFCHTTFRHTRGRGSATASPPFDDFAEQFRCANR